MRHFIFLFVFLAMTAPVLAQDALYGYEEGTEYKYIIEQTGLTIQDFQGQSRTSNSEITISSVLTVKEKLDAGHQRMQMLVDNALAISEGGEQTETFGPEAAGKSVTFELDAKGDIVDVDTSINELEPKARSLVMASTNIFPTFDASQLTIGNEWESTEIDTAGDGGETEIITESERTYTVKGEKEINGHTCFEILIATEADISGKQVMGGQEIMVSGTREGQTKLYYAPDTRLMVKIEADINTDQTLLLTANNMRVAITGNQTVKVELVSP